MEKLIYTITLLVISISVFGQEYTAGSAKNGTWLDANTWISSDPVALPPDGTWTNGKTIIIEHTVDIANNKVVDLSGSTVEEIILREPGVLVFNANAQLILPDDAKITFENGVIDASNESNHTVIKFGENAVWGKAACAECNGTISGTGVMDKNFNQLGILPIELLSFKATVMYNTVQLDWTTVWEENFDFFTVERAVSNMEFEAIGTVKGNNNTTAEVNYTFTDHTPTVGQTFYRLKATDHDGTVEYHKIISVHFDGYQAGTTKVYPNPIIDHVLTIEPLEISSQEIWLLDLSGNTIYTTKLSIGLKEINLPATIRPGAYFLKVRNSKGNMHQQKIMII